MQEKNPTPAVPAVFSFESHAVRTMTIEGEPWFVAADVCSAVELGNVTKAVGRLDDDERTLTTIQGASNGLEMNVVNESGLYSLILTSRKPEAKRFKKWVTSEVLPSIRKNGSYTPALAIPQTLPEALRLAADLAEDKAKLIEHVAIIQPKADVADRISMSEGYITITDAAKILKVRPRWFSRWLRVNRWTYQRPGHRAMIPYQERITAGYMDMKYVLVPSEDDKDRTFPQAIFLPKGIAKIAEIFEKGVVGVEHE